MTGQPKLLVQVADALRVLHRSPRTAKAYVHWTRRYILFHGKRHPRELGRSEIEQFLNHLAVTQHVSASTDHLQHVRRLHDGDRAMGAGYVELPDAFSRKYPNAACDWL